MENSPVVAAIMAKKMPEEPAQDDGMTEMHAIAHELIEGLHSKNVDQVAEALGAFKDCMRSEDESQDMEEMPEAGE